MMKNNKLLSQYEIIGEISEDHGVHLVMDKESGDYYVLKALSVYNLAVYESIKNKPIPHTPLIHELIEADGTLYVIEQYIMGETLAERLEKEGLFNDVTVLDIGLKLCDILSDLHSHEPALIHRDIKPSNLILRPDGELILLDFNAAKFYAKDSDKESDTVLLGTHGYAAPEQYGFGTSGPETDIYALGILMNHLLKGKLSHELAEKSSLTDVISKCLKLNPKDRYSSADELKKALISISPAGKVSLLPPGFRERNPLHMVIGSIGYGVLFYIFFCLERGSDYPSQLVLADRVFCLVTGLMVILFSCNYGNIHRFLPRNKMLRGILVICIDFAILAAMFAILNGIQTILV